MQRVVDCVGRLERRNDSLQLSRALESRQCLVVGNSDIGCAAAIAQPGVFGARARVIESG